MDVRRLVVADASVLIDLLNGGILEQALKLPLARTMVEPVASQELLSPSADHLKALGVPAVIPEKGDLGEAQLIRKKQKGLSVQDAFTMVVCRRLAAVPLAGDELLRREARITGLEVHGALWVLDLMVARGLLRPREAASALRRMLETGSWLPQGECKARFRKWKGAAGP